MDPTARNRDRGKSRNKCKASSPFDHRPCRPQLFERANPTPTIRRCVTCGREFAPDLQVPGPWKKDSGKDLDAQKFAFAALNSW